MRVLRMVDGGRGHRNEMQCLATTMDEASVTIVLAPDTQALHAGFAKFTTTTATLLCLAKLLRTRGEASPVSSLFVCLFVVVHAMLSSQYPRGINDARSRDKTGGTTATSPYPLRKDIPLLAYAPVWRIQ